jgi:peroxin-19
MGDNLDDLLDSALDDFEDIDQKSHFPPPRANANTVNNQQTTTATSTSNVNNNSNNNTTNSNQPGDANKEYGAPLEDTEKLVEEFQRDMGKVLEELQGPDFMKALDEMAKKMQEEEKKMDGNVPQSNTPSNNNNNNSSSSGDPKLTEEEEIQKKLQETLKMLTENVKKMEENANKPSDANQDQMFEDLLKGMESDDQLSGMVENVMKQLISKDILYEPMKEMQAKYPKWLADNKSKVSAEDYQKYVQQYEYVNKIVNSYNTNPNYFDEVVNLMQAMQECGQPPEELMQQMSPEGAEIPKLFGNDGAPGKDGGCPMQ